MITKSLLRFATFFSLILFLLIAPAQQQPVAFQGLVKVYKEAQEYYDKASRLGYLKNYGTEEEKKEALWNARALEIFSTLYNKIPPGLPQNDSLRYFTAFKIAELQHYFDKIAEANHFYRQAIKIREQSRLPDSLSFQPLLYSGIIFYNQNKFDTALQFFSEAENLQIKYRQKLTGGERLYNILGVLFYERGNYKQAGNYFQKALDVLPKSHYAYRDLFVNYNINLAQLYLKEEDYDKANNIYQQLLPLRIHSNEIYHNLGSLNLSLGAVHKALFYFRKVQYNNNKIVRLYNSMGKAFYNISKPDSANFYYQKAIAANSKLQANSDPVGYGLALSGMGELARHEGNFIAALQYYQRAIQQFYPAFNETAVAKNPLIYSGVFSYINLFYTLTAKAEVWHDLYLKDNKTEYAIGEMKTYQSAFSLIAYVERTYDSDEARLFLSKIKQAVHYKPIDIAYILYATTKDAQYLEALYQFDQQNKAATLALSRQINKRNTSELLPLEKKEIELKSNITRLSIRASTITDSFQLNNINTNIRNLEIELGKVQDALNKKNNGTAIDIPTISQLQKNLPDNETAVISYHLSNEKLTTIFIGKNELNCLQQPLPPNFDTLVKAYLHSLQKPSNINLSFSQPDLTTILLHNIQLNKIKTLIIIPDDILLYLPFESLMVSAGRYLIEDVAVQYHYTTTLLQTNTNNFAGAPVLALAPFTKEDPNGHFEKLPLSQTEIAGLPGKQLLDTAATKSNFLKLSGGYKIIHLATHAVVNTNAENLSYIAFYQGVPDSFLYAQEVYNLSLQNTDLVILSACETGAGQLVKGEGIMSLSRAFSYAGCANVITTLWKADDFSTAYLLARIHFYLAKKYNLAQAVQQAKNDYLSDKKIHPRLKHPYYWSHIIFIGNYNAQAFNYRPWIIAGGLVILLIVIFMVLKKPGRTRL